MKLIFFFSTFMALVSCATSNFPTINGGRGVAEVTNGDEPRGFATPSDPTLVENGVYKCGDMTVTVAPDSIKLDDEVVVKRNEKPKCGWSSLDGDTKLKLTERKNTLTMIVENDLYDTNSVLQIVLKRKGNAYSLDRMGMSTNDYGSLKSETIKKSQPCVKK